MNETFGQRFQRLRKAKGFKQEDIAQKVNISAQAVSKWENDLSSPDISILPELADLFDISLDELLGREVIKTELVPLENRKDIKTMILKIMMLDDKDKVKINLPMALILAFLEGNVNLPAPTINGKTVLNSINFKSVVEMVEQGVIGRLVEIESDDGVKVDIWVE